MRGNHSLLILLVCALCGAGSTAPAAEPGGGMRQPIGPGGMPPGGGQMGGPMGGPIGGPPVRGTGRPGPMGPGADPSAIFPRPARPEDPTERRGTSISYRGTRYFVSDGQWFEQRGRRLIAVEAPAGVMVRDLPEGYSMRWIDGVPYFYAEGLYYIWREGERRYEILTAAPAGNVAPAANRADDPANAPGGPEK